MNTKKKKLIMIGILNIVLLTICVVIPNRSRNKYITIYDMKVFIILLLILLFIFILNLYFLGYSKKSKNTCFVTWMFLFSLFSYIIVGFLFSECIESRTTNINNYFNYDKAFEDADLSLFPSKIPKSSKNIVFNYIYKTYDNTFWNSDMDLYLELELSEEDYIREKEKVKKLQKFDLERNNFYNNSDIEYVEKNLSRKIDMDFNNHSFYNFIAFFDETHTVIYNYTQGYIKPYFVDVNEDRIECSNDICKIS